MAKKTFSDECIFCVKYLKEHGILSDKFEELGKLITELDVDYELVKIKKQPNASKTKKELRNEFFLDLAEELRLLWPPGNKDGKWPWRCDKLSLANRLAMLWKDRKLSEDITKEEVISVAKEYLSKFSEDNKYMKTVKYYVYKFNSEPAKDKNLVTCISPLADALEARNDMRKLEAELDELLAESSVGEGELR